MALRAKKELNSELNLTPFIDLLSTIVCFLLVSAVWVQVSSLDLKQSQGTEAAAATETAALDVDFLGKNSASLVLKLGNRVLSKALITEADPKAFIEKLNLAVIALKQLPALKAGDIQSVLVGPHGSVTHGELIAALDGLRLHGFTNIGVKPSTGRN